jgi:hypothetical protein
VQVEKNPSSYISPNDRFVSFWVEVGKQYKLHFSAESLSCFKHKECQSGEFLTINGTCNERKFLIALNILVISCSRELCSQVYIGWAFQTLIKSRAYWDLRFMLSYAYYSCSENIKC